MVSPHGGVTIYPSLAFILLGVIVGLAFVADGWRAHPDEESVGLFKSPKIRGILYIIGGTFISAIQPLLDTLEPSVATANIGGPVYTYLLGCTVTILAALFLLTFLVFVVSINKIKFAEPNANLWKLASEACEFSLVALQEGYQSCLVKINARLDNSHLERIRRIEIQRDATIQFFGGYFASLVVNISNGKTGSENYIAFLESYCLELRRRILVPSQSWRVGVYQLDKNRHQFLYLLGSYPLNAPHSHQPIPFSGSLARYAYNHPFSPHIYVDKNRPKESSNELIFYRDDQESQGDEGAFFFRRQAKNWYKTVIVCAVKHVKPPRNDLPELILCVDFVDDISESEDFAFIRTTVLLIALAFADAALGMNILDKALLQTLSAPQQNELEDQE